MSQYELRLSEKGHPYRVYPVPQIDPHLPDSVIYLYRSDPDAKTGSQSGGSGCLVSVPSELTGLVHIYAVTCAHVVRKGLGNSPVIRITKRNSKEVDVLPFKETDWLCHPHGDDVAVRHLALVGEKSVYSAVPLSKFVKQTECEGTHPQIGPGNDVFFLGRFMTHDGKELNKPTVRFGNVALAEPTKISNKKTGVDQESILVEARSLPGYSGSGVFVVPLPYGASGMSVMAARFLGVDWCHLSQLKPVVNGNNEPIQDLRYEQNSGMMGVVPAWILANLLGLTELEGQRQMIEKEHEQEETAVSLDAEAEQVFTKSDFESALKKVSKRLQPSPPDEGKSKT